MDSALYKTHAVSRGLKYHYFFTPAQDKKPVLLLLHGFPSTSYDWHRLVATFRSQGYGVLVPDLLGYGGTDKPHDVAEYRLSLMVRDIVDLLDAENVQHAVSIGHDWGSALNSRLANRFPDRFLGFAFLALGYFPPSPEFDIDSVLAQSKAAFGYELYGYWPFLSRDDAHEIVERNFDSAFSLWFPHDPKLWVTDGAPLGGAEKWITANKHAPLPSYLSDSEAAVLKNHQSKNGMRGPMLWYKMATTLLSEDDKSIPQSAYAVTKPVFLGLAKQDYICLPVVQQMITTPLCAQLTEKTYDGDHWIVFCHADALAADLHEWVNGIVNTDS